MADANTTPPPKPHSGVRVEVTEYSPVTGLPTRQLTSLNLDKTTVLHFSTPIAIKMNVAGVHKIDNIKIGIMKSSLTIESSGATNSDGSKNNGNAGIEKSLMLTEKTTLTSFFGGINTTGSPSDENIVSVKNSTDTESEFVYLSLQMPDNSCRGYIGIKWFFDFV